jgi:thiol-disulfide isomerase/thioredoxin
MNPKAFLMLAILAGGGAWYALDNQLGVNTAGEEKMAAEPAPQVSFTALGSANTLALSDLQGRWVLLNVWASWCPPCLAEFPDLIELAEDFPQQLTLLAVTTDKQPEAAEAFLTKLNVPAAENIFIAHDPEREITQQVFFAYKYPESILIDPQGMMVRKFAGALTAEDLKTIRRLIND